jgi:hypothetical protein
MPKFNLRPNWEACKVTGRPIGVDRKNAIIRGYVVAQEGPFKSMDRGEFDGQALESIVSLMAANRGGTKSRFAHPDASNDGLGKFLGRAHNPAMSTALDERTGKTVQAVRADLHFDKTALETPPQGGRPLGDYVMALAESDPGALSSSLMVKVDEEYRLEPDGTRRKGADGEPLPPLWRPKDIHASDIVNVGDAADALLSPETIDGLPLAALWRGEELLDSVFDGQPREVIRERLTAWLDRYLTRKFGVGERQSVQVIDHRREPRTFERRRRQRKREGS